MKHTKEGIRGAYIYLEAVIVWYLLHALFGVPYTLLVQQLLFSLTVKRYRLAITDLT